MTQEQKKEYEEAVNGLQGFEDVKVYVDNEGFYHLIDNNNNNI